jgi:putative flippase GtrA
MSKIKNIYKKHCNVKSLKFLITYSILSVIAASVELSFLYLFTSILNIYYMVSVIPAYFIGGSLQFILIKYFSFKNKSKKIIQQASKYFLVISVGFLLTLCLMYIFVELFHIWYLFARIITIFIIVVYSISMHKYFTFSHNG